MNHLMLGLLPMDESMMHNNLNEEMEVEIAEKVAPDSWNWLDQGAVTSVKKVLLQF